MAMVAAGVGALVVLLAILASNQRERVLSLLVGVSAGLVAAQVANVHVFTVIVIVWWLCAPRRMTPNRVWPGWIIVAVIPIALTALTGDLVTNSKLGVQFIFLACNASMIGSRLTKDSLVDMLRGLLVACSAASLMSIGQVVHVLPNKGFHTDVISAGRPYAFYPEPDWAGLFSTLGVILAFRTLRPRGRWYYGLLLLNAMGSALAAARAAWVALVACVLIFLLAGVVRRGEASRRAVFGGVIALAAMGVVALAVAPHIGSELSTRAESLVHPDAQTDVSGRAREQQTAGLRDLAETAPWYGHGLSASGHVGVSGLYVAASGNSVGSNWVLSMWVDAKYLSLPFLLLVVGLALATIRTVPGQILAFLCVHNLFTNATIQPVTWFILGSAVATLTFAKVVTNDVGAPSSEPNLVGRTRR